MTPKCFDILLVLIESQDEVVSRESLMNRVWPDSFVEENNLTYNISVLRKALGARAGERQFILTVPGRGYRFIASVREVRGESADLIVEERTSSRVVIEQEQETSKSDRPAVLEPTAEAKALTAVSAASGATKRRVNRVALAVGVALIAFSVAVAYFWIASRSKPAHSEPVASASKERRAGGDQINRGAAVQAAGI